MCFWLFNEPNSNTNVLISCFCSFWVLTWGVRFIIGRSQSSRTLHRSYGFFRLCCPLVYSARTLGNSTHTYSFLSPTLPCLPHIPRQGIVVNLHTLQALRLMATVKLPIDFCVFGSMLSTHISCCLCFASLRILPNYFTVTVGTQDFRSQSFIQRKGPVRVNT